MRSRRTRLLQTIPEEEEELIPPINRDEWKRATELDEASDRAENVTYALCFAASLLVVLGIILIGTDPACVIHKSLPICRRSPAPTSAPPTSSPSSGFVYSATTAYVFDAASYENSYVAVHWQNEGTLYHPGDSSYFENVSSCPTRVDYEYCSLLLNVNETHHVQSALRFDAFHIQSVYANATRVVVVGTGLNVANSSWIIPGSNDVIIERGHTGKAGLVIVYQRDASTGILEYSTSALVLEPEPANGGFKMNRGTMNSDRVFVAFSGAGSGDEWIMTPMRYQHTNSTDDDLTLTVDNSQAVVLVYSQDGSIDAAWHFSADAVGADPCVNVKIVEHEDTSYIALYGVYAAPSTGLNAGEFVIPLFATSLVPGEIPSTSSPPGPSVSWESSLSIGYVIRYQLSNYEYVDYVRHEVLTDNVHLHQRASDRLQFCGEADIWTEIDVYEFNAENSSSVLTFEHAYSESLKPYCCEWFFVNGSLIACQIYGGTAETVINNPYPLVFTALAPGWISISDDITKDSTNVTFSGTNVTMTLPIPYEYTQSNYEFAYDDYALPSISFLTESFYWHAHYVYDGNSKLWFGVDDGVRYYDTR
jgi:hypothetical protein